MKSEAIFDSERLSMYKQAQESLSRYVSQLIPHEELQAEISNKVLLSLIHEENEVPDIDAWIRRKTDVHLESCIKNLWQFAYRQARQMYLEQEEAEDLAQSVMITLLNSKKPIQYTRAWLKNSVFNQASDILRKRTKQHELQQRIKDELTVARQLQEPAENELENSLTPRVLKKLLSKEDYSNLMSIRSFNTLRDYARSNGISYSNAREIKHRIVTNLKAQYFIKQGWIGTSAILDYRILINLKRFVNVLVDHARNKDFTNMSRYAPQDISHELEAVFSGFNTVTKWEISMQRNRILELCLLDLSDSAKPGGVIITLTLNKANQIKITKSYKVGQIFIIPSQKVGPLPVDKGRCLLTLEQIKSYLG